MIDHRETTMLTLPNGHRAVLPPPVDFSALLDSITAGKGRSLGNPALGIWVFWDAATQTQIAYCESARRWDISSPVNESEFLDNVARLDAHLHEAAAPGHG